VRGLRGALERLVLVLVYAGLLSVVVTFFADIVFGDLVGHFGLLFLTLWLFVVAVCLAVAGLSALVGLASIVLVLVLITLGNPSSGGPVPRPLLNGFYSGLSPVMPQGAALSAVRGVQYFGDRGIGLGLLCLLIWALAGLALLGGTVFRDALRN
jgi:ABC-type multidrug transport system permease subunit